MTSNPSDFAKMYGGSLVTSKDGKVLTTSLKVAEVFDRAHFNVLRDINELECSDEFKELNFEFSSYRPANAKRPYPMVEMTRDGFSMLVMGFTGKKADLWKEQFINAFNLMEQRLVKIDPDFAALSSQITALTGMIQGIADQNMEMKPKAALASSITDDMRRFPIKVAAKELTLRLGREIKCSDIKKLLMTKHLMVKQWVCNQRYYLPTSNAYALGLCEDNSATFIGPKYFFTKLGMNFLENNLEVA